MGKAKMFKSFLVVSFFLISGESMAASSASSKSAASPASKEDGKSAQAPVAVSAKKEEKAAAPAVEVVEAVDDKGEQAKKEKDDVKENEKFFVDIVISGKVLRARDEVALDRADKVVHKGLGVRVEDPQIDFAGHPALRKKFEFFHKSYGIWLTTNMKNEVMLDDCANIAHQGRKSESKFKITLKNYPVHSLYWKDQVHLLSYLKQFFAKDLKKGEKKDKDIVDLAKKKHLLGYIPVRLEEVSVSCELVP